MPSPVFTLPVRIYWEDTDAGGIVYHANYLRYMERARGEFLRSAGFEQRRMQEAGMPVIVVADLSLKYRRPAKLDDLLTVKTRVKLIRAASVVFAQEVWRDDTLLVSAEVRCAAVDPEKGTPVTIPDALSEACCRMLAEAETTTDTENK